MSWPRALPSDSLAPAPPPPVSLGLPPIWGPEVCVGPSWAQLSYGVGWTLDEPGLRGPCRLLRG